MKKKVSLLLLCFMIFITLSCTGEEDFELGISMSNCNSICGELPTCQTSRGNITEEGKLAVTFPYGGISEDGERDYPEGLASINATLTATVDGEGSIEVTVKTADGQTLTATASNGSPAVISGVFQVEVEEKRNGDNLQSANIIGISVEPVELPVIDAQLNLSISDCVDAYCTKTHSICAPR